jgi:hypothetical protein
MKWNGSAGWRYNQLDEDDQLASVVTWNAATGTKDISTVKTKSHQMRANIGATGGWENVEYGFGLRTGGGGTINDDYVNAQSGGDRAIGVDAAWFRYVRDFGSVDMGLTIGRQKNALAYDSAWETNYDNDVRWDGFGWNFKMGMFGFNASQYILGSTKNNTLNASNFSYSEASQQGSIPAASGATDNTAKFAVVYAFQPTMTWKFSDEIEAMFAVGFAKWNATGFTNRTGAGVAAARLTNTAANGGSVPAIGQSAMRVNGMSQLDFLANVTLPYNLAFVFDYVKAGKASYNSESIAGFTPTTGTEVGTHALTLGLTYGKLKKAHDFTIGYAFTNKAIASQVGAFSNDKFAPDNKGSTVVAGYSLADNFHLGFKYMRLEEKERMDTITAQAIGAYGGTKANQKMISKYWELTAGVAF